MATQLFNAKWPWLSSEIVERFNYRNLMLLSEAL
jgi:hypothetical protein